MAEILQDLAPESLIRAIETNFFEFIAGPVAQWSKIKVFNEPHLLRTICPINFPIFNSVTNAQLPSENLDETIEAILAPYKAQNLILGWRIGHLTRPKDLTTTLEAHGFKRGTALPGMALDLQTLPTEAPLLADFTIEVVENEATLQVWSDVSGRAFEMPDFVNTALLECYTQVMAHPQPLLRHYVGRLKGEAVATSSLFIGAGVAGIYDVATLPHVRGKGLGTAITLAPLYYARELGYRAAILHSSEEGYNVYQRIGFQPYCQIVRYLWKND